MKIVGLEEHFVTQDVLAAWHALDAPWRDPGLQHHEHGDIGARLIDLAECRVADMDAMGMDLQGLRLQFGSPHCHVPPDWFLHHRLIEPAMGRLSRIVVTSGQ